MAQQAQSEGDGPQGRSFGPDAASYDKWYRKALGRVYDRFEKRAVERLLPLASRGASLLEIGCGTGHWTAFFSKLGYRVTGVDCSDEMIRVARRKRIPNAEFVLADAHSLPFASGTFDAVAAITVLEFVHDAEKVVGEMARCAVLPGGRLVLGVLNGLAPVNIQRKAGRRGVWREARFFAPDEVKGILQVHGRPRLIVSAFVPQSRWALSLAPLAEMVGSFTKSQRGAFIAASVELQ